MKIKDGKWKKHKSGRQKEEGEGRGGEGEEKKMKEKYNMESFFGDQPLLSKGSELGSARYNPVTLHWKKTSFPFPVDINYK